jgi:hypothetical protein
VDGDLIFGDLAECIEPWAAALLLIGALIPTQSLSRYGAQPNPMGFHEGARRTVTCDGGYVTGFDAYMSHLGGFAEPTLNALRVICSSSRIQVEYETGSLPDTMVFGQLPPEVANLVQPVKGGSKAVGGRAMEPCQQLLRIGMKHQQMRTVAVAADMVTASESSLVSDKLWYQAGVLIMVSGSVTMQNNQFGAVSVVV